MLVTSFCKVIGASLGLFISVASTSPIDTPQETTVLLESRKVAEPNLCGDSQWVRRECVPSSSPSPQAWRDICQGTQGQPTQTVLLSSCPTDFTVCENIVDEDGNKSIKCVDIMEPGQSSTITTPLDPQIGSSESKSAVIPPGTSQLSAAVTIQNDMSASVSAVVLSMDKSYVITPQGIIVGQIRGREAVCNGNQSDAAQAIECYPSGRYDLKQGDIIDFRWAMVFSQTGFLAYTIWPTP